MLPLKKSDRDGTISVKLNTDFYDLYPITEVCEKFKDLAKIQVILNQDKKQISVTLTPKGDDDPKMLALEFCNHTLHIQIKGA